MTDINQNFGHQPSVPTWKRLLGLLSASSFVMLLCGAVGQAILPPRFKPTVIIGEMMGTLESSETLTKQPAAVEYLRQQAEAQAQAQARAQMEAEINRQQQQARLDALQAQVTISNAADTSCVLGSILSVLTKDNTASDWHQAGEVMTAACGVGAAMRDGITQEQSRTGREGQSLQDRLNGPR